MNTRAAPASNAFPDLGLAGDFYNLCVQGICRALEMEQSSLAAVFRWNACVIEICKDALWISPTFDDLVIATLQALAGYMKLQVVLTPFALSSVREASGTVASNLDSQVPATAEELAHSMDIAIGAVPIGGLAGRALLIKGWAA